MTDAHTKGPWELRRKVRREALLQACLQLRDDYGTSDLDEVITMLTPSAPTTRTSHD